MGLFSNLTLNNLKTIKTFFFKHFLHNFKPCHNIFKKKIFYRNSFFNLRMTTNF